MRQVLLLVWVLGFAATALAADEAEEQAKQLIVMVDCRLGSIDSFGAGILFGSTSSRLYVATANHVVRSGLKEAENLRIEVRSLPGERLEAILLGHADEDLDLAVLAVDLSSQSVPLDLVSFDRLGNTNTLERGDSVHHLGQPNGIDWYVSVSDDRISEVVGNTIAFESGTVSPGNSGGGLFNERWELLGMVRADETLRAEAVTVQSIVNRLQQFGYPVSLATASVKHSAAAEVSTTTAAPETDAATKARHRLPAPIPSSPRCGSTVRLPPENHFFNFGWEPVEGASHYTVEVDCLGCNGIGSQWHSQAGSPWWLRERTGRRTPICNSNVHVDLFRQRGRSLRWRVWAIGQDGVAGLKSDWCQFSFGGR